MALSKIEFGKEMNTKIVNQKNDNGNNQTSGVNSIQKLLIEGEKSGICKRTPEELVEAVIEKRRENGTL